MGTGEVTGIPGHKECPYFLCHMESRMKFSIMYHTLLQLTESHTSARDDFFSYTN